MGEWYRVFFSKTHLKSFFFFLKTLTDLLNPENKNLKIRENTEVGFIPV